MKTLRYCVQCTDYVSGNIGCFAYEPDSFVKGKGFKAVSEVFPSLIEFFAWAKSEGWKSVPYGLTFEMTKGDAQ